MTKYFKQKFELKRRGEIIEIAFGLRDNPDVILLTFDEARLLVSEISGLVGGSDLILRPPKTDYRVDNVD
jgi:hypothetical protein